MTTKQTIFAFAAAAMLASCGNRETTVTTMQQLPQTDYAASLITRNISSMPKGYRISISVAGDTVGKPAEGFTLQRKGKKISIMGNDASGAIYGSNRLMEYFRMNGSLEIPYTIIDAPEMKLRGACVGLQKTVYLPGHKVYEYPYTPENFPWFYYKDLWVRYLDMLEPTI